MSDESTLEIRADVESDWRRVSCRGNTEAERQRDLLKADKIKYYTDTKTSAQVMLVILMSNFSVF